jgi:hypothetical protein
MLRSRNQSQQQPTPQQVMEARLQDRLARLDAMHPRTLLPIAGVSPVPPPDDRWSIPMGVPAQEAPQNDLGSALKHALAQFARS